MKRSLRAAPSVAGALLLSFVLGGSAPAWAQLAAEPESLRVALAPSEEAERVLTLTNTGSEAVSFCLSFERPLQRVAAGLRLSQAATGAACGPPGEILLQVDGQSAMIGWRPYGLTMTPDGRLFAADNGSLDRTHELTPELAVVRSFEHPTVAELEPHPATWGVTYTPDTDTLWWLNVEQEGADLYRALLLEGDLDGVATGRRIELPIAQEAPPPDDVIYPFGVSYDSATARYYYVGTSLGGTSMIWAVDSLGAVVPGYPVEQNAYPETTNLGFGPDAHGGAGGEPEAVRLELAASLAGGDGFDRLVVVDPEGRELGIPEVMLPDLTGGTPAGGIQSNPLRSRTDPNGLLYFAFGNFDAVGIVGIRPHPLPPSWLSLNAWDGTLAPGESMDITLVFSSGTRAVGSAYQASLQVFEAVTGAAAEVPLSFEVVPVTDAEDGAEVSTETSLAVFPNPSAGQATVAVGLPARAALRVAVFDVLGRRVALLHDGPVEAGHHRFALDAAALPSGLYLVRLEAGAARILQRLTLVR